MPVDAKQIILNPKVDSHKFGAEAYCPYKFSPKIMCYETMYSKM